MEPNIVSLNRNYRGYIDFIEEKNFLSIQNDYIPYYAFSTGEILSNPSTNKRTLLYNQLSYTHDRSASVLIRYSSYFSFNGIIDYKGKKSVEWEDKVFFRMGYYNLSCVRTDEPPKVLCILAIKSSEIFNLMDYAHDPSLPYDHSSLKLLIDREFIDNKLFRKLYLPFERKVLSVYSKRIDFILTNNINDLCFKEKQLPLQKFKTLQEKLVFLKSINQKISDYL